MAFFDALSIIVDKNENQQYKQEYTMINALKKSIFLAMVLIVTTSCKEITGNLKYYNIKNNSSRAIYYGLVYLYTDSNLKNIEFVPGVDGNTSHKIKPNGQNMAKVGSSNMQIFIFDADIIENTPWDTIVKYNMVLKRYQFTESELEQMDWEIIYDGK
ncbi:hypothetical protein N9J39_01835 [Flavicella sp.]|nr:hypothetical protein [Flavicella sp.]MDA9111599.1 hypothetical protein [Flavicella sp.]